MRKIVIIDGGPRTTRSFSQRNGRSSFLQRGQEAREAGKRIAEKIIQ